MTRLKICFILLLAIIGLAAVSCSSDDDDNTVSTSIETTLSTTSLSFVKGGEVKTLSILSAEQPTVTSSATWCTVEPVTTTESNTYKYNVTASANTDTDERTATLYVTAGSYSGTVSVTQSAEDALIVGQSTYSDIPAIGQEITITLTSNGDYSYTTNVSWISAATTRAMTSSSVTFVVATNTGSAREGTITFKLNDLQETVSVSQLAGEAHTISGSDALEVAESLGLGWNLGNQLDSFSDGVSSETIWGNPAITQSLIDKIAESGFSTVRIPVTWMGHIGEAPDYTIEDEWLDRVYEVVGYVETAGLNAIVNIHHDGADSGYWLNIVNALADEDARTTINEELSAVWTQIATKFKDKGDFLMFESMNEIHDGTWVLGSNASEKYAIVNEWNQTFVNAVRSTGGNNATRYLGMPGYQTNIDYTIDGFEMPSDPTASNRLMVAVHYYDPYDFCLGATYSEWGHTGKSTAGWGDEDYMTGQFQKLKTMYIDNNIPVYIGEMGCVHRSNDSFRLYYLEYLCKAAKDYGLAPIYWDNGGTGSGAEQSALINRSTLQYVNNGEEAIQMMKRGVYSEDSSYTLETVYATAP